jgi:CRISPR-associated protein Cas1
MWPCRGVAEHAYCPRLFYYMTVEGVFVPSADTEQGLGTHRRVDRPSHMPREATRSPEADAGVGDGPSGEAALDPDRPRTVRSLVLSSEKLGLTATLDLVELDGPKAVPVEYRKGRPRRASQPAEPLDEMLEEPRLVPRPEAWPTDRVQLGLQVVLLEEAGFSVSEAYLYYAGERLKLRVTVDDALRRDALAELEAAKKTAQGPRPAPLINDARCPRCSLQPICLPDEINHQRLIALTADGKPLDRDDLTPRKLWPPRDDGIQVVVQRHGGKVGVRGQSVRVTDKDGELVKELPLANIESLALVGSVQVSTQALAVFAEHEVPVAYLSPAGRLVALMDPLGPTSAAVRTAQIRTLDQAPRALELARAITVAKISNQRTLCGDHLALLVVAAAEAPCPIEAPRYGRPCGRGPVAAASCSIGQPLRRWSTSRQSQ